MYLSARGLSLGAWPLSAYPVSPALVSRGINSLLLKELLELFLSVS